MNTVHIELAEQLSIAIEATKKHYNKKRKDIEPFRPGELVMLNGKNI